MRSNPGIAILRLDRADADTRCVAERLSFDVLAAGQWESQSTQLRLPPRLDAGIYRVMIVIDAGDDTIERDELGIGTWKTSVGTPFVPAADAERMPPHNNACDFLIEVVAPPADLQQRGKGVFMHSLGRRRVGVVDSE